MTGERFVDGPVLGLETTGRLTGAALLRHGRLQEEFAVDARALSQEILGDRIDRLLRGHGLRPRDLERIGVALGPGSFTGVRVGLSLARGLALGAGRPLVGVPSHEAMAWPLRDWPGPIVLLTGLRRGEIFLELGRWQGAAWEPILPGQSRPVETIAEVLRGAASGERCLFVGEAVDPAAALLPELAALGTRNTDPLAPVRRPAAVAYLAARPAAPLVSGEAVDRLGPIYLRGADARRPGERAAGGRT